MAEATIDEIAGDEADQELPPLSGGPTSLLQELDARQDQLLNELEKLNARIEKVIAEWGVVREDGAEKTSLPKAA